MPTSDVLPRTFGIREKQSRTRNTTNQGLFHASVGGIFPPKVLYPPKKPGDFMTHIRVPREVALSFSADGAHTVNVFIDCALQLYASVQVNYNYN